MPPKRWGRAQPVITIRRGGWRTAIEPRCQGRLPQLSGAERCQQLAVLPCRAAVCGLTSLKALLLSLSGVLVSVLYVCGSAYAQALGDDDGFGFQRW